MNDQTSPLPPLVSGLPVLGSLIDFYREPLTVLERGYHQHGSIFRIKLMNQEAIVLVGPELSRVFFDETDRRLSIREAYPFFARMFDEHMYFLAPPEEYKEQRSIVLPCFQGRKMTSYVDVMVEETHLFMQQLGERGTFDLTPSLGPLVMNIAAHSFLGRDFRFRLGGQFFDLFRVFSGGMEMVLPLWLPLPHLVRAGRAREQIRGLIQQLIDARRAEHGTHEDFLSQLLEARYSDGAPLSDDVIINLILLLVWAGHETTAGHISWAMVDLLQNPDYLEQVLEEQDALLGPDGVLTMEKSRELKHMEWALKETERLHPVAYMLLRKAVETMEIGGYRIPAGSMVFAAPAFSHRLPEVFAEPDRFDPVRFSPERAEDRQAYSLIGFGGGVHRCAGVNFAYLEMKVALTTLLQQYRFELVDLDPRPVRGGATKWPDSPCRVRYERRRSWRPREAVPVNPRETEEPAGARCPMHTS